jgi:hypothetical protein
VVREWGKNFSAEQHRLSQIDFVYATHHYLYLSFSASGVLKKRNNAVIRGRVAAGKVTYVCSLSFMQVFPAG